MKQSEIAFLFLVIFFATTSFTQQPPTLEEVRARVGVGNCYEEKGVVYVIGRSESYHLPTAIDEASVTAKAVIKEYLRHRFPAGVLVARLSGFKPIEYYPEFANNRFRADVLVSAPIKISKRRRKT